MKKIELLSPAGNLEKLKYVYEYGADAAYVGIGGLSLRSRAENFEAVTPDELESIKGNQKLYGAVNIYFADTNLDLLMDKIDDIRNGPYDALIVSDLGAARRLQKELPHIRLHLSTQANCTNSESAKMYRDLGFSRIILSRELSLKQIERIRRAVPDIELEVFVHGAMCWAYSGRCYLSAFLASRSANQGNCAHSCRWEYRVLEERKRPGEYLPVEEGEGYTLVLSSKDLCMFDYMPKLIDTGIDSCKIEGRMKSLYYGAVVTRAYRKAIDAARGRPITNLLGFREELFKVSHREFSTGFFFGDPDSQLPAESEYQREYLFLGTIGREVAEHIFELSVKNQLRAGDEIEYIGPDIIYEVDKQFVLLDGDKNEVEKIDHGRPAFICTSRRIRHGYIIRKRIPR